MRRVVIRRRSLIRLPKVPDWSYHPLLKPIGVRLHGDNVGPLTLKRLRTFVSTSVRRWLIRFVGHMELNPGLAIEKNGLHFAGRVILNSKIDSQAVAIRAFSQFAFGAIEISQDAPRNQMFNGVQHIRLVDRDATVADYEVAECSLEVYKQRQRSEQPTFVKLPSKHEDTDVLEIVAQPKTGLIVCADSPTEVIEHVQHIRNLVGNDVIIAAGDYIETPRQALQLIDAGADMVYVGNGLATSGPGIAKRINETIMGRQNAGANVSNWTVGSIAATLFGLGVIFAGVIATYLGLTSVILGYDETFVHLSRAQLLAIDPHLLHFMKHDRLSYAGATLSIGVIYTALAMFGIRRREVWATHMFNIAGLAGFVTVSLFFLFHYVDYGNIAVAFVLLPFFFVALLKQPTAYNFGHLNDLDNDAIWRRGLVGQLLLVALAVGLIIGGIAICVIGSTHVFVVSDLQYLHTTSAHLEHGHPQLLSLIAHDRVSFGGTITCNGLVLLLMGLWGYQRGSAWLWWTILIAGSLNLGLTLYAHFSTGYTEFGHLLPVFVGGAFFIASLIFSHGYLCYENKGAEG